MSGPDSLAEVRNRIDAIDADLVDLLARRQALAQRAARLETGHDAVRVPERELPEDRARPGARVRVRAAGPGDMGWIVHRHGVLYAAEYGLGSRFEAMVAGIVAAYLQRHDPQAERAWIAELDGRPVGSVACVRHSERAAALRLLMLEPDARGRGIGRHLVAECIAFARQAGYHHLFLTTADILGQARRTYQQAGFQPTGRERRHHDFGPALTEEEWSLQLRPRTTERGKDSDAGADR